MPDLEPTASKSQVVIAEEAFAANEAIKLTVRQMRTTWTVLAQQLYEFSEAKGWQSLGYATMDEWLADPDIGLSRRMVFYMTEIQRELVVKRGVTAEQLQGIDITKAREIVPAIRRGEVEVGDALADARVLGRDDLKEKYNQVVRPGVDEPVQDRPLDATTEPEFCQCEACGSWYKTRKEAA